MISSRNFDNLPSIGLLITYPKSNAPEGIYMSLIDTFHYFKWPNFDWTPLNSPEVSSFGSDKHSWMKFLTQEGSNAGKHRRRKHFGGDLTIAGADITVCRPSKGPLENQYRKRSRLVSARLRMNQTRLSWQPCKWVLVVLGRAPSDSILHRLETRCSSNRLMARRYGFKTIRWYWIGWQKGWLILEIWVEKHLENQQICKFSKTHLHFWLCFYSLLKI